MFSPQEGHKQRVRKSQEIFRPVKRFLLENMFEYFIKWPFLLVAYFK